MSWRRKTCPRCAEKVRAEAQVCRYCGHEFNRGPTGEPAEPPVAAAEQPQAAKPSVVSSVTPPLAPAREAHPTPIVVTPQRPAEPPASVGQDEKQPRHWVTVLRWLALLLYLALAWPLVISDDTADQGVATALPVGLLLAGLWLLFVTFLWWLIRRLFRRPRPYDRLVLAFPVLLVALVLAAASAVGRNAADEQATAEQVAADTPGPGSPEEKLEQRRANFTDWFDGFLDMTVALRAMNDPLRRVIKQSKGTPDQQLVARLFGRAQRNARQVRQRAAALPNGDPGLDPINAQLRRASRLFVAGTTDYVVGWRDGTDRIEAGDPKLAQGTRLVRHAGVAGDRLYEKLGGEDAFGQRLDWDRLLGMAREH